MNDKVRALLEDKVNDIFLEMQKELNIQSGDISPLMSLKLNDSMEDLATIITDVLKSQQ